MPVLTTHYKGDMLFETDVGTHRIEVDVPAEMGGQDRAPQPPQLFVASLGSCVAALVADYCNHHGLDATGLSVDVQFEKAQHPTRLEDLHVRIHLPNAACGDACTTDVIQRVAEHCPVHETMHLHEHVEFEVLAGD